MPDAHRFRSPTAQSTMEYALMATLVVLGILIMGPYVLRSVNAYFKGADEQAQASFREKFYQAPTGNYNLPNCTCSGLQAGQCGNGTDCPRTERVYTRTCSGLGCDQIAAVKQVYGPMQTCEVDKTCCTDWVHTGLCGPNAKDVTGGCPAGSEEVYQTCGDSSDKKYDCQASSACLITCSPAQNAAHSTWCNGPSSYSGLVPGDSTTTTYVDYGTAANPSSNCTGQTCEAYCDQDYPHAKNDGSGCEKPAACDYGTCSCAHFDCSGLYDPQDPSKCGMGTGCCAAYCCGPVWWDCYAGQTGCEVCPPGVTGGGYGCFYGDCVSINDSCASCENDSSQGICNDGTCTCYSFRGGQDNFCTCSTSFCSKSDICHSLDNWSWFCKDLDFCSWSDTTKCSAK